MIPAALADHATLQGLHAVHAHVSHQMVGGMCLDALVASGEDWGGAFKSALAHIESLSMGTLTGPCIVKAPILYLPLRPPGLPLTILLSTFRI